MSTSSLTRSALWSVALALMLGMALVMGRAALAAEQPQQRRLVLQLDLHRQGPAASGAKRRQHRLSQHWRLDALLASGGVLMINNPLDPEDAHRRAEAVLNVGAARSQIAEGERKALSAAEGLAMQKEMHSRI